MARIRTIKPEFWTDEKLSELPEAVHMLAAALLNYADDHGYFNANPKLVKAACFPLREPSVSVHEALMQLVHIDYIRLADGTDGRSYGWIVAFDKHQRVNRPSPSRIASLVEHWNSSVSIHGGLTEDSLPEQGTGNREVEQGSGSGTREPGTPAAASTPIGNRVVTGSYPPEFMMWWQTYPSNKRTKIALTFEFWNAACEALVRAGETARPGIRTRAHAEDWLLNRLRQFVRSPASKGRYAAGSESWLRDGRYDDGDGAWDDGGSDQPRKQKVVGPEDAANYNPVTGISK